MKINITSGLWNGSWEYFSEKGEKSFIFCERNWIPSDVLYKHLKIILSLALILALAGSLSKVAFAHSGHHSRRAKNVHQVTCTGNRRGVSGTAENTAVNNTTANTATTATTASAASDTTPVYASCYENGYCTGNNSCDVNGVCQYGGICDGAPCYQETCPWDGGCVVDGVCQYGGNCYGLANQNAGNGGNYGHHGGGHHGGHHR